MDKLKLIVGVLLIFWLIASNIFYAIVNLVKLYTCRKIVTCKNRKCIIRYSCQKYSEKPTPEEYERILKLIDTLDD